MDEQLIQLILQGGANVAFALFLFHQNREQKVAFSERELKLESREQELIGRYEKKIDEQQIREDKGRESLNSEVKDMDKRVAVIETKLEAIFLILQEIKALYIKI